VRDDIISYQPQKYSSEYTKFSVEIASMVYQDGLNVYDVVNTTFKISADRIRIMPEGPGVVIHINDSDGSPEKSVTFKSNLD